MALSQRGAVVIIVCAETLMNILPETRNKIMPVMKLSWTDDDEEDEDDDEDDEDEEDGDDDDDNDKIQTLRYLD